MINELQTELNVKKETLAQQLIAKSQQLPNIAKATVGERIIEPIQLRVDGFKQTVKAIPLRTRVKIDQVVVDPINRRVKEIKAGIGRIPVETSAKLNKMVDSFHVGCFDRAPGCSHHGPATEQHSWFPGYAWTIALCGDCGVHLGWLFRSKVDEFYGLILDHLVSCAPD